MSEEMQAEESTVVTVPAADRSGENDGGGTVVRMPTNRGGGKPEGVPPAGLRGSKSPFASSIEANAPEFKHPREYQQWLDGKVTRREVVEDFDKLRSGIFSTVALAESVRSLHESLLRYLMKRSVIEQADYAAHVKAQAEFREFLDALNASPETPMKEKVDLALSWNADHPELMVMGNYVKGLVQYLRENPDGLDLLKRADVAADLLVKEEQVFSEKELSELADALLARADDGGNVTATVVPSGEGEEVSGG